jgi:hypothetical protein
MKRWGMVAPGAKMLNKTPAIISSILTVILLIIFAILSVFAQMIALNGVSESQGITAMGISLVCQGVGVILAGVFAGWLSRLVITKFNWNKVLAVIVAVMAGILLGGAISLLSTIISIPLAGIG